jgi:hypothetical protein
MPDLFASRGGTSIAARPAMLTLRNVGMMLAMTSMVVACVANVTGTDDPTGDGPTSKVSQALDAGDTCATHSKVISVTKSGEDACFVAQDAARKILLDFCTGFAGCTANYGTITYGGDGTSCTAHGTQQNPPPADTAFCMHN